MQKTKNKKDFILQGYQLCICLHCGAHFLEPQPTDEKLAKIYSDDYFLGGNDKKSRELVNSMKRTTANLYLEQFVEATKLNKGELNLLSLLEIGCGLGDFLMEAQSKGFQVAGLEVSDYLVQLTNTRLGKKCVEKGVIETANFKSESFDVITFFDVIEHVRDPETFLKNVHKLLKVSGKIFLVTPSLDSWSAHLLGRHWMEYKVEHLFYFGKKSLKLLLEQMGFRNIRFIPNYKILNFDYINHHFVRFPVAGLTPLLGIIRKFIPDKLAFMPIKLIASGMGVIAEK